jgi:hypothetical protein
MECFYSTLNGHNLSPAFCQLYIHPHSNSLPLLFLYSWSSYSPIDCFNQTERAERNIRLCIVANEDNKNEVFDIYNSLRLSENAAKTTCKEKSICTKVCTQICFKHPEKSTKINYIQYM